MSRDHSQKFWVATTNMSYKLLYLLHIFSYPVLKVSFPSTRVLRLKYLNLIHNNSTNFKIHGVIWFELSPRICWILWQWKGIRTRLDGKYCGNCRCTFMIEDYSNYWNHRRLRGAWIFTPRLRQDSLHHIHMFIGLRFWSWAFLTYWGLWFILREMESIEFLLKFLGSPTETFHW